ncbi:MAG: polymer-forming cytoskeletal protein [Acidobacteriota bacterium]
MSLFGREQQPAKPTSSPSPVSPVQPSGGRVSTLVAAGSKVTGKISGPTEVVIEGELEGEIRVEGNAVVGSAGLVKGEISARTIRVAGKVLGNIRGLERVEVLASGSLEGDVSAPRVVIAEGAFFKGKVEMTGNKPDEKPAKQDDKK